MNDLVTKIVDCVRDGEVIASYPFSWARTLGPSSPPPKELIDEAKSNLSIERKAAPPFEGITFEIRDP